MRNTKPRKVILEELRKVVTHPSADEIYSMVRERLPHVSLGTVYRNLDIMAESGMVLKLEMAGTQRRYDGTTDNHYHVRCRMCGRVDDLPIKPLGGIESEAREASTYEISGHRLEFTGLCPACRVRGKSKAAARHRREGTAILGADTALVRTAIWPFTLSPKTKQHARGHTEKRSRMPQGMKTGTFSSRLSISAEQ